MGGSNSCCRSSGSDEKSAAVTVNKGNRPNDYTEIDDDFLPAERSVASENGGAKQEDNVEEMYENCSSIIRASNIELQGKGDKSNTNLASDGRLLAPPLADVMKNSAAPTTNGKKAKRGKSQLVPPIEKAPELVPAHGSRNGEVHSQAPAFCLGNPSEIGHYLNVQPAGLKKPPPLPKEYHQEPKDGADVYAQVQKPKPKIVNGNSQQLNYIEVEFPQSPSNDNKIAVNFRSEQSSTTYTDVIHKDGKIMLVSPNS